MNCGPIERVCRHALVVGTAPPGAGAVAGLFWPGCSPVWICGNWRSIGWRTSGRGGWRWRWRPRDWPCSWARGAGTSALRVIRCVVHVGMSVRFGFIGNFFSLIHFTATGGDAARTTHYARRFGFGMSQLAALAPMNRALGAVAAVVVGAVALGLGWAAGGGEGLARRARRRSRGPWSGCWVSPCWRCRRL